MKVMGKEHIKKRNEVKHIMAERNVLISNVNHPFLVALHYSFQTKDKLYFVLDYLNGGEVILLYGNYAFKALLPAIISENMKTTTHNNLSFVFSSFRMCILNQ